MIGDINLHYFIGVAFDEGQTHGGSWHSYVRFLIYIQSTHKTKASFIDPSSLFSSLSLFRTAILASYQQALKVIQRVADSISIPIASLFPLSAEKEQQQKDKKTAIPTAANQSLIMDILQKSLSASTKQESSSKLTQLLSAYTPKKQQQDQKEEDDEFDWFFDNNSTDNKTNNNNNNDKRSPPLQQNQQTDSPKSGGDRSIDNHNNPASNPPSKWKKIADGINHGQTEEMNLTLEVIKLLEANQQQVSTIT